MGTQEVNQAFLSAFTRDDLERLTRFGLDVDLSSIVDGGNLQSQVFALVEWASRNGRLADLIMAARAETTNPDVLALRVPAPVAINSPVTYSVVPVSVTNDEQNLLKYQIEELKAETAKLDRIVSGADGLGGIRGDVLHLRFSVSKLEEQGKNGTNLLQSKSSRLIFGLLFGFLLLLLLITSGALSSFGIG